jgi:hypothetical protein
MTLCCDNIQRLQLKMPCMCCFPIIQEKVPLVLAIEKMKVHRPAFLGKIPCPIIHVSQQIET